MWIPCLSNNLSELPNFAHHIICIPSWITILSAYHHESPYYLHTIMNHHIICIYHHESSWITILSAYHHESPYYLHTIMNHHIICIPSWITILSAYHHESPYICIPSWITILSAYHHESPYYLHTIMNHHIIHIICIPSWITILSAYHHEYITMNKQPHAPSISSMCQLFDRENYSPCTAA